MVRSTRVKRLATGTTRINPRPYNSACSTRATSQSSRPVGNWMPYKLGALHEGQKPITDRAPNDVKTGSKIEGMPPEGCWQNQSGHRYHSANFQPGIRQPVYSTSVNR